MIKAICDVVANWVDGPGRGGDALDMHWAERQRPVELPYWMASGAYHDPRGGRLLSSLSPFADDSMPSAIRSTP